MANDPKVQPLTEEDKIKQVEAREEAIKDLAYCTVQPFSDMLLEIYPPDHPFIYRTHSKVDPETLKILQLKNPFENKGALLCFGRACMRFALTEEDIDPLCAHLQELKKQLKDINDAKQTVDDRLLLVPIRDDYGNPDAKTFTFKEGQDERKVEPKDTTVREPTITADTPPATPGPLKSTDQKILSPNVGGGISDRVLRSEGVQSDPPSKENKGSS